MKKIFLIFCLLVLITSISYAKGWKQDKFMITMWCHPPVSQDSAKMLSNDKYTVTGTQILHSNGDPKANLKELDILQKQGVKAFIFDSELLVPEVLNDPAKLTKLNELIDTVKGHPALEGYHLTDEPSAMTFEKWAKLSEYIKKRDPKSLCYINLFPTYANQQQLGVFLDKPLDYNPGVPTTVEGLDFQSDTVKNYAEHLDKYFEIVKPELLSYDHYNFFKNGNDGAQYYLNLEMISKWAYKHNIPFMNIVQDCTIEQSWRLITKDELRLLAYSTIGYGGKAISWFLMWGPPEVGGLYQAPSWGGEFDEKYRQPQADWTAEVNKELTILGPELMKLTFTGAKHCAPLPIGTVSFSKDDKATIDSGNFFIGYFKDNKKANVFMVVNRNYKENSTATIKLSYGKKSLYEFSQQSNKWIKFANTSNKTINVELRPGAGRLFKYIN